MTTPQPFDEHPSPDALVADPMDPATARHLAKCAKCRIDRRILLAYLESDPPTPTGMSAGLGALLTMVEQDAATSADRRASGQRLIGRGPRGPVYEEYDPVAGRLVAVKVLHDADVERVYRAAEVLAQLRHPNLEGFRIGGEAGPLVIRRRLVERDLAQVIDAVRPAWIQQWFARLASALAILHDAGLAHGAICPENLRVEMGSLHLVDAGLGGLPDGSPWRAPELGAGQATPAGDWYALGKVLERYAPQLSQGPQDAFTLSTLLARMCDSDPAQRPTAGQVLAILLLDGPPDALIGTVYEDRGLIDRGGMGEVRRVWDVRARREVALKRMNPEFAARDAAYQRFRWEARIAAQVQHPSIIPVYEVGEDRGQPYYTMKLVEGGTLDQLLKDRAAGTRPDWDLPRLLDAFRRLCEAVSYAHSRGVLHLDLKPKNVMLGQFGEVFLLDWGVARQLPGTEASVSETGLQTYISPLSVGGTPGYMATEQARPLPYLLATTSDTWALGQNLLQILGSAKTVPGSADVRAACPDAPPELRSVVEKALREAQSERYQSAEHLGRDVAAWLAGERVSAHDYTSAERFQRWFRPYQGPVALAGVVLLVLGAFGLTVDQARQSVHGKVVAEAGTGVLVAMAELAHGNRVVAETELVDSLERAWAVGELVPEGRAALAKLWRAPYLTRLGPCTSAAGAVTCADPGVDWPAGGVPVAIGASQPAAAAVGVEGDQLWVERDGVRLASPPLGWGVDPDQVEDVRPCGPGVVARARDQLAVWLPGAEPVFRKLEPAPTTTPVCSPRGDRVAFARGAELDVRSTANLFEIVPLAGHPGGTRELAWSGDGALIASYGDDRNLRLWSLAPGKESELSRIPNQSGVTRLGFAPGRRVLLTDGAAAEAWDASLSLPERLPVRARQRALTWASATAAVSVVDDQGHSSLWDVGTGARRGDEVNIRETQVKESAPTPDGAAVVVRTGDGVVRSMRVGIGNDKLWKKDDQRFTAIAMVGDAVVAGSQAGTVQVWRASDGTPAGKPWDEGAPVVELLPLDQAVVVRTADRTTIRELGGALRRSLEPAVLAATDSHGQAVALVRPDSAVDLYSVATDQLRRALPAGSPISGLAVRWDPASRRTLLAVGRADGLVEVWTDPDGAWVLAGQAAVGSHDTLLAFSPSGETLALGGDRDDVELWDTAPLLAEPVTLQAALTDRFGQ